MSVSQARRHASFYALPGPPASDRLLAGLGDPGPLRQEASGREIAGTFQARPSPGGHPDCRRFLPAALVQGLLSLVALLLIVS